MTSLAHRTGLLVRVATTGSTTALTFDDGPDPVFTPKILDLLAERGARATFFVDGPSAEREPALLRRITAEGHEIGLHGWSHTSAETPAMSGLRAQVRDLRRAKRAVGQRVRLYRPAYGHESRWTRLAAGLCGVQLVYWSASTEDWRPSPVAELAGRIESAIQPGAIVLMHDRLRTAVDPQAFDRQFMVDALSQALDHAERVVKFVTVSELRAVGTPVIRRRRHSHDALAPMIEQAL